MRHQNRIKKLGRTAAHRKATLSAMASALVEHKRIETTLPKAKALRSYVEPLINRAKEDTTANRRQVFRRLQNKESVKELFGDIAARIGDRPGGYTRVIKLGLRQGDAAEMAVIELVDYNDVKPDGASSGRKRTRRGGSGGRKSAGQKAQQPQAKQQKAAPAGSGADDLTKVYGIGKVFEGALHSAGITTYAQLAGADLDTLRAAISEGSEGSDASANEETWAEQAAFLAKGDKAGYDAYIERMKAAGGTAHHAPDTDVAEAPETPEAGDPSGETETVAEAEAPEAEAEAPAAEDASTQSDDAPETPSDEETMHPDTPQGAAPETGEPPPETGEGDKGTAGGSQHRG